MLDWFTLIEYLTKHFPNWVVALMIPFLIALGVMSIIGVQIIILFTADLYKKFVRPIFNFPESSTD